MLAKRFIKKKMETGKKIKIFVCLFIMIFLSKGQVMTPDQVFTMVRDSCKKEENSTLIDIVQKQVPIVAEVYTNLSLDAIQEKLDEIDKDSLSNLTSIEFVSKGIHDKMALKKIKSAMRNLTLCQKNLISLQSAHKKSTLIALIKGAIGIQKTKALLKMVELRLSQGQTIKSQIQRDLKTNKAQSVPKMTQFQVQQLSQGLMNTLTKIMSSIGPSQTTFQALAGKFMFSSHIDNVTQAKLQQLQNTSGTIKAQINNIQCYLTKMKNQFSADEFAKLTQQADNGKGSIYSLTKSIEMILNPDSTNQTDPFASTVPTNFTLGLQYTLTNSNTKP